MKQVIDSTEHPQSWRSQPSRYDRRPSPSNNHNNNNNVQTIEKSDPAAIKQNEVGDVVFPGWDKTQLLCMEGAEMNVLAIDVESNNPSRGPVRVCAFVLLSYQRLLQYEIVDRAQFIVERTSDEYDEDGRVFWKEKAIAIDRYFDSPKTVRLSPATAAKHIRAYLDHCWNTVPRMAILVDEPQTDHALLYEFLKSHGCAPMCYDAKGTYKRNVHVSRDLMRGAFSMIDPRFMNLETSDMYLCIHRYWEELVKTQSQHAGGLSTTLSHSPNVLSLNEHCIARTQLGPELKHVPVFDATQSLHVWAKMEDIKRLFHAQLNQIAKTLPSLIVLPKSGHQILQPQAQSQPLYLSNTHPIGFTQSFPFHPFHP